MTTLRPNPIRNGHAAAVIRAAMKRLDFAPADLNQKLGRMRGHSGVYMWMNAKALPADDMRAQVAKLLGVAEADLLPRAEAPKPVPDLGPRLPAPRTSIGHGDVLSFRVNGGGEARITLDITLGLDKAVPLLRMLLDAGLVLVKPSPEAG